MGGAAMAGVLLVGFIGEFAAGEAGCQNFNHHGDACTLVATKGQQHALQHLVRVRGWLAVRAEAKTFRHAVDHHGRRS